MIFAVTNQKGGTGKTTTAQAIATGATHRGRKALAIDLDPQGNLTFSMGGNAGDAGAYELITGKATPGQIIQHTRQGDIIPASSTLATADTLLAGDSRLYSLQAAIKPVKGKYDVIVIDCPPVMGTLLLNALIAADRVIIPLTADMYALQGLYQLADTIRTAQAANTGLQIGGVLFTRHSGRTILARDLSDIIRDKCRELDIPTYRATIREGVAIREAQSQRESIFDYAPKSKPAKDYAQLLDEMGL